MSTSPTALSILFAEPLARDEISFAYSLFSFYVKFREGPNLTAAKCKSVGRLLLRQCLSHSGLTLRHRGLKIPFSALLAGGTRTSGAVAIAWNSLDQTIAVERLP